MDNIRLFELFRKYYDGRASQAETDDLAVMVNQLSDEELSKLLSEIWNENDGKQVLLNSTLREKLFSKIKFPEDDSEVIRMGGRKRLMLRISAAAAIVLILSVSAFFFLKKDKELIAENQSKKSKVNDVPPGGNKAILTLGDNTKIILDTAANGALTVQGGIKVIKIGGLLSYNKATNSTQVVFNTITTPRGGQYKLELADGSRVWLNAASSLKFPNAFNGDERTVELTGEGYFEVSHNPSKPFHVKVNDMDVAVLGTHFNINSYSDEPTVKTTLLEGRVKVKNSTNHIFLNPGQQAKVDGSKMVIDNDVNVDEVMAWKNGYFSFNNADIRTLMRQLSRWYDIDVVYEGNNEETFSGKIDRNLSLRDLLDGLGQTIHYRIQAGGKLVVLP